jgi:hypothetical protein
MTTTLFESGMPREQRQKFLGHAKRETTQVLVESSTEMLWESTRDAVTVRRPGVRRPRGVASALLACLQKQSDTSLFLSLFGPLLCNPLKNVDLRLQLA